MPSQFPGANDTFVEPSAPETTPLSSSGTGTKNHVEHHRDLGDAIEAMQANVAVTTHDHSGSGARATPKLSQANTHQSPDTDSAPTALHHTLGLGANQAAPGNHTHDYNGASITGQPYIICTSTTRPAAPRYGMQIFETNTNRVRIWAQFPTDSAPRWALLPVASFPVCRLLQGTPQNISPSGSILEWRTEEEDNFGMFNGASSLVDSIVQEPGLYSVKASVSWTTTNFFADHAMTCITVNGQETPRKHWEFVRGNDFFNPGFPQSVDVAAEMRFVAGDRIGVKAAHNANQWLFTFSSSTSKQDSRLEISYKSP